MASASSTIFPFSSSLKSSASTRRHLRVSASCTRFSGSLYEVLGIQTGATCQEIKAAYRRLARILHPDVARTSKDPVAREFMRVHDAYATLSDPQKRADYDRSLFPRRGRVEHSLAASRGSTANSGFQGYTGRKWETDQCW